MFIWFVRLLTAAVMVVTFIPDTPLVFLPVNTFLAYLPIELSYQILRNKTKRVVMYCYQSGYSFFLISLTY